MLRLLRSGDVYLDVGASMGIYSVAAASLVGKEGEVVAIEGDRSKAQRLHLNARLNHYEKIVRVHNVIAAAKSSSTSLEVSLDDYYVESGYRIPTIIKIDVDGFENQVVAGLTETLQRPEVRLLQIEFDSSDHGLVSSLQNLGFRLVAFETHKSRDENVFSGSQTIGNGWFVRHPLALTSQE